MANDVGVSPRTIKRWSKADGQWRKLIGPEMTAKAHAAADRLAKAVRQVGGDEAPEEDKAAAEAAIRLEVAADERGTVLDRHRSEWRIVRGLTAEAVRKRDREAARLAESVARTLKLTQDGERKAWGLDVNDDGSTTILVERD